MLTSQLHQMFTSILKAWMSLMFQKPAIKGNWAGTLEYRSVFIHVLLLSVKYLPSLHLRDSHSSHQCNSLIPAACLMVDQRTAAPFPSLLNQPLSHMDKSGFVCCLMLYQRSPTPPPPHLPSHLPQIDQSGFVYWCLDSGLLSLHSRMSQT